MVRELSTRGPAVPLSSPLKYTLSSCAEAKRCMLKWFGFMSQNFSPRGKEGHFPWFSFPWDFVQFWSLTLGSIVRPFSPLGGSNDVCGAWNAVAGRKLQAKRAFGIGSWPSFSESPRGFAVLKIHIAIVPCQGNFPLSLLLQSLPWTVHHFPGNSTASPTLPESKEPGACPLHGEAGALDRESGSLVSSLSSIPTELCNFTEVTYPLWASPTFPLSLGALVAHGLYCRVLAT